MSLKLYFLDRFGGMKRTKKIDRQRREMWECYQQFQQLKETDEFAHFLKLEEEVHSDEFAQRKASINALKYKGSAEQEKVSEYERLSTSGKLASYYKVVESEDFKRFKELDSSYLIKEFKLSKEYVDKEFQHDKKVFEDKKANGNESLVWEDSKAYQKYRLYEEMLNTDDVKFWQSYLKSKDYGSYKEHVNSTDRVKVEALRREIQAEAFKEKRAFLENPNRWETTPEYTRLKKHEKMSSDAKYADYIKFREDPYFKFFSQYNVLFHEEFKGATLQEENWHHMSSYAAKHAGFAFSHESDKQGYTQGKNAKHDHETLCINTEKQETEAFVWINKLGFVPSVFNYSSGAVSHKQPIRVKQGVIETKVKYYSTKKLVDLFYLANDDYSFRLNVLEMGVRTQVGYQKGSEVIAESIKGLRQGKYYIFKVEWSESRVTWWVNNHQLLEVKIDLPDEDLFLNLRTIVTDDKPKTPHQLQVDWVTVFSK
ncbi:MAG: hypothetical protein ACK5JS_01790 [Mangrovibacterium sp.]